MNVTNRVQSALPSFRRSLGARRNNAEALVVGASVHHAVQRERQAGPALHLQLCHHQRAGRNFAHARASARRRCLRSSTIRCGSGSTSSASSASISRPPMSSRPSNAKRAGPGRPHRRAAHRGGPAISDQCSDAGAAQTPEQFGNIVLRANPDGSMLRVRDVARVEIGAQSEDEEARTQRQAAVALASICRRAPTRSNRGARQGHARQACARVFPGAEVGVVFNSTTFVTPPSTKCSTTLGKAFILVVIVVFAVPRQSARHPHSGDRGSRQPDRHVRRFCFCSAIPRTRSLFSPWCSPSASWWTTPSSLSRTWRASWRRSPELSPARDEESDDADHGADDRDTFVLFSVFAPTAFLPGMTGDCSASSR